MSYTFCNTEISGIVRDEHNNRLLEGCNITLEGTKIGVTTNQSGHYCFNNVEPGMYTLCAEYIGYITTVETIQVNIDQTLNIDFCLSPTVIKGNEVVVTATRTEHRLVDIPGRIDVVTHAELNSLPTQNLDDILKYLSGLNVHRTSGIFEIRPVVSLRGVSGDEPGRTLVLVNSTPINKSDTGVANWNRINVANIKQIEIFKGAGSSLYGNNAMGGVINIITQTPDDNFSGKAHASYGTYNTLSGNQYISGRKNAYYYNFGWFTRKSDGYYDLPDSLQDDYSVPLFLDEKGISTTVGSNFTPNNTFEIIYDYYDDKRGEGVKIEEKDGKHRSFDTNMLQVKLTGKNKKSRYEINGFYQHENYLRVSEDFKNGSYYKFDVSSNRIDRGVLFNYTRDIGSYHLITIGSELKSGSVDGGDYYATPDTTPRDTVLNRGKMQFRTLYLQDEFNLFGNKLRFVAGIRYDNVKFHQGYFHANLESNPFYSYNGHLDENEWNAMSPRVAVKYHFGNQMSGYLSYSQGFRASILDDLCRSGWMRLGPKEANPDLGPETIDSYELGLDYSPTSNVKISPSFYFSKGHDFLYFVATGDSLWGRKPIYKRENITGVDIYGAEIDFTFRPNHNISLHGNYSYNHSTIFEFSKNPELEENYLVYSPIHQANATMQWRNKYLNINFGINYKDKQFTNDDNSEELAAYYTIDAQLSKVLYKKVNIAIDFQNITDKRQTEHLERLSPGRLINLMLSYDW